MYGGGVVAWCGGGFLSVPRVKVGLVVEFVKKLVDFQGFGVGVVLPPMPIFAPVIVQKSDGFQVCASLGISGVGWKAFVDCRVLSLGSRTHSVEVVDVL